MNTNIRPGTVLGGQVTFCRSVSQIGTRVAPNFTKGMIRVVGIVEVEPMNLTTTLFDSDKRAIGLFGNSYIDSLFCSHVMSYHSGDRNSNYMVVKAVQKSKQKSKMYRERCPSG